MTGFDEHVLRLDVAVDHAVLVGEGQGIEHLAKDSRCVADRHRSLAGQARAERLAAYERHHVVQVPVGHARRQDRHDVRMLEAGDDLDLPPEAVAADPGGRLAREHLDDHVAVERHVPGHEDPRHAGTAELALEDVGLTQGALQ